MEKVDDNNDQESMPTNSAMEEQIESLILEKLEEIKQELKEIKQGGFIGQQHAEEVPTNGNQYEIGDFLNSGAYGAVFTVTDVEKQQQFAMKVIALQNNEITESLVREMFILRDTQHENIVRLEKIFISPSSVNLVMEYVPYDLQSELETNPNAYQSPSEIKKYVKQILDALSYLHKKGIIHRDVKPENILVQKIGVGEKQLKKLKLADFGSSKFVGGSHTPQVVTLQYRAPEILLGSVNYTTAVDLWSVGCLFYEFLMARPLVEDHSESELHVIQQIFKKLGTPTEATWAGVCSLPNYPTDMPQFIEKELEGEISAELDFEGRDLILQLLSVDPSKRITAEMALEHPYLQGV
ncbi:cell division control protein 2 homolog isoform X1 [Chenopodium quinoa]|uniref:cell division control protein 2 homolog isoform X1 n=2 Tax=Chenopodium quinoa TaxID=63459 RepID=UPI000B76D789|nr:cell division control protein 2 homolog isoform X1 [Chenopodium quinoa]